MSNQKQMVKIAINKSILKEYKNGNSLDERIVYLDNGSEFQIQIFNPHDFVVGARIYINGVSMSYMLVLRPGERIWLERYLDKSVKFRFETYEVDADEETKKAIQKNGEVKVVFYKEEHKPEPISIPTWHPLVWNNTHTYEDPYAPKYDDLVATIGGSVKLNALYEDERSATLKNVDISDVHNISDKNLSFCVNDMSLTTSTADTSFTTDTTLNYNKPLNKLHRTTLKTSGSDKIETGRIEEGGYSNQQFNDVYRNFEKQTFSIETIKLLPTSQKQYNSSDLKKHYCTQCGRKINMKHKYCPYCGNKIE